MKLRTIGLLVTVAVVLVVACAKATPTPTPTPTRAPTATPTPTPLAGPTPTPTTPPSGQTASLTMTVPELVPMVGWPPVAPFKSWEVSLTYGITENLFVVEGDNTMTPWLAESWALSPDLKSYEIKLRQGIPWISPPGVNKDFGELTAEDVAFYFNQCNAVVNPMSTCGDSGNIAAIFGEFEVVDKYTVRIPAIGTANDLQPARIVSEKISIRSKKVYDEMGVDWMRDHAVGTGPFVLKEWEGNVRGVVEAVPNHWRTTAHIKELVSLEVPELSSAVAMLKTGEADIAYLDFKAVPDLVDQGFVFLAGAGGHITENISALLPGNLWEETHASTGEPLEPWKSAPYAKDYPWVGNPWGDKVPYKDTNNPPGIDDMEQARLVRWALAYAIDREKINEEILGGLGGPIYIEYIAPSSEGFDATRKTPDGDPWVFAYDKSKAMDLLKQAGYSAGFDITINAYAAEVGPVALEIADAVTTMWRDVGVNATQERVDYGAVVSPKLRERQQVQPIFKNCDVFSNFYPLDWPFPPTETSLTRPGWGCGIESPYLVEMHLKISAEPNKQKRIEMHYEVLDYMYHEMLIPGIVERPNGVVANPKTVKSWESRKKMGSPWNYPQYIVPAD